MLKHLIKLMGKDETNCSLIKIQNLIKDINREVDFIQVVYIFLQVVLSTVLGIIVVLRSSCEQN